ncbi:Copper-transporting P-type ATPase [Paraburkholderia caffeinitolerans]|uniref:Copper-transporting P-type ATPase n=1 Tax=Paraburkholderia caffeinitolerans TaxID=1723730 RepID=A0A6J5FX63_9BURK|nr:Copper-transporting P-type ATPase [Paraburkholderia caffeinitolerans]
MTALLSHAPRNATRLEAGQWNRVSLEHFAVGDRLMVRHADIVPVGGTLAGNAELDESTLTGESHLCTHEGGATARSGAINAGPTFEMIASATAAHSTFAGIVRMVEMTQRDCSPAVRLATPGGLSPAHS